MKKELADDLDSIMSGPPRQLQTDTTHKTKTVVKRLAKINLNHHLIYSSFAKALRRFEVLMSDQHLKIILLKLDCYNI